MDHSSSMPTFLFGLVDLEGSSSILNLLLEIVEDEPSCHGLASSASGITDHDKELEFLFFDQVQLVISGLDPFCFF